MEEGVRSKDALRAEGKQIASSFLETMGDAVYDGTKEGITRNISDDIDSSDGTRDEIPECLRGAADYFREIACDLEAMAASAESHR